MTQKSVVAGWEKKPCTHCRSSCTLIWNKPKQNPSDSNKRTHRSFLPHFGTHQSRERQREEGGFQKISHILPMAARNALLKYLRVNVHPLQSSIQNPKGFVGGPFSHFLRRRNFSEEVRGSFLDKSEVTDRVISVVKNFQKVEPSKVTLTIFCLYFIFSKWVYPWFQIWGIIKVLIYIIA